MKKLAIAIVAACLVLYSGGDAYSVEARRMTPELLWKLARIGEAAISPDGKLIAYAVTRYDLAANSGKSDLVIAKLPQDLDGNQTTSSSASAAFGTPKFQLESKVVVNGVKGLNSLNWIKRPEGIRLLYVGPTAGDKPTAQAWILDPDVAMPTQLTHVTEGIANLKASPSGDRIAFTVDVKMDQTVNDLYADLPKADARIIDGLMYRHWNAWHDFAYSHVHVAKFGADGKLLPAVDLMRSLKADCPLPPFGGAEQFDFAPDGRQIALTLKLVNNPAESTDSGIYLVDTDGGPLECITPGMSGYDREPRYAADGRTIAFHSMARAGFEADRSRIMLYDRAAKSLKEITRDLDQNAQHVSWANDSQKLFFQSEMLGTTQLSEIDAHTGRVRTLTSGQFDFGVVGPIPGTSLLVATQQNMLRPVELLLVDTRTGHLQTLTDENGAIFEKLDLPRVEQRWFQASDGKQIHNWVILPPGYDAKSDKQWPMLTYCQGGPQGQIGQWFSYRWNFHLMAAKGYVVLAVNRRGMPGFGQQWNDQISGDWGGQAMRDILASTDAMIADPTIDRRKVAAIGASFGGYTVYWLMGNHADRFCAMISHCGVYNLESMYGSTEELFFVNWDLGGPYWKNGIIQGEYDNFSPHRFAGNWKTPLLVIHGEKDFRVPITQGMEAFTVAQVQGVPSRFLYFPNEGHWVTSPQNSVLWSRVFFDWLDRYCQPK